jgi:hypothetical protein
VNAVKNAPKDIRAIIKELQSLRDVLERLELLATSEETTGSSRLSTLEQLRKSDGMLAECMRELGDLEKKLKLPEGWKGRKKALIWPIGEADARKTLSILERTKTTLNLALVVDQTYGPSAPREEYADISCSSLVLVTHDHMAELAKSSKQAQLGRSSIGILS